MIKKIFLFIVVLAVAVGAYGYYLFNKPHQSVTDQSPAFTLQSQILVDSFEKDEQVANKLYLGKIIEVTGVVSEKSKDEKGKLSITLQGQDMSGIGCEFEPAAQTKASTLTEGQKVTIKGICTGILIDVVLVDCVVTN